MLHFQLKENRFENEVRHHALDGVIKALEDAEAKCPGITDSLVEGLVKRFQKQVHDCKSGAIISLITHDL